MSHDHLDSVDHRHATIALWNALLDVPDLNSLHRVFETTILANEWEHALPDGWRGLGFAALSLAATTTPPNIDALPIDERAYARAFFGAVADVSETLSPNATLAHRERARLALEAEHARRVAQSATAPLPLGLPAPTFAVRLPTLPTAEGHDPRESTTLLLRPRTPHPTAPVLAVECQLWPSGLNLQITPCDRHGEPLSRPHATADAPGQSLAHATWDDLGLGANGPFISIDDTHILGDAFDVRHVAGTDRSALLLCSRYDAVAIELEDAGEAIRCTIRCASAAAPITTELRYDSRALTATAEPSARPSFGL